MSNKQRIPGTTIDVEAENCTVEIVNGRVEVDRIVSGSQVVFSSTYAFARENWFYIKTNYNNHFIANSLRVNPAKGRALTRNHIEFRTTPNHINTNSNNQLDFTFDIVNENGRLNDPVMRIKWFG